MDPTRLLLVRHGQTAGNEGGGQVLLGHTDLPLTPEGLRQARCLAARLRRRPLAAIYSSPLQRAGATAQEVAVGRPVRVRWCRGLREIDCGAADGLEVEAVQRRYPAAWEANRRQDDADFRWPGGESYRELRGRVLQACDRIASRHAGARVLVVTHAGVVNQVVGSLEGLDPARWEPRRPRHCTVTEVEWGRERRRLVTFDGVP